MSYTWARSEGVELGRTETVDLLSEGWIGEETVRIESGRIREQGRILPGSDRDKSRGLAGLDLDVAAIARRDLHRSDDVPEVLLQPSKEAQGLVHERIESNMLEQ
jgi:hypothetical protein